MIVGQRSVNLGKTEMPVLCRDFFWSQAHLVPSRDAHHSDARSGDFGPTTPYRGIAVDQTSNLDGTDHGSIIAKPFKFGPGCMLARAIGGRRARGSRRQCFALPPTRK